MTSNHATTVTRHTLSTDRHTTSYLAAGPESGPLMIFVHGWPELAHSWRHQLPVFGALGFRCIAPDLRGYGSSSVYDKHEDYAQEHVVADMCELHDALGAEPAIWVGHDWGSPTVWLMASIYPERCKAVANLCVPHGTLLNVGGRTIADLIDRDLYPAEEFPAGQWEYQVFYVENFDVAVQGLAGNIENTVKAVFRRGDPKHLGKPARTAYVRKNGGWFGPGMPAPDMPADNAVLTDEDVKTYTESLSRNGFFGPCSYYMNHPANGTYALKSPTECRLSMPVLFVHARYDTTCLTLDTALSEPMRELCSNLTEAVVDSGHWMAQEKPVDVNHTLAMWLGSKVMSE